MKVLSAQALIAVLLALGIEKTLALPTGDVNASLASVTDADLAYEEAPVDDSVHLLARAPGDSQADPSLRSINAGETGVDGAQELFDADCYAHLCQGASVIMNWWDQNNKNRQVEPGNGVASKQPFKKENHANFYTQSPDNFKNYISPEEWPPASSRQGGKPAILFPVTNAAQQHQSGVMSAFWQGSPKLTQQKGDAGSTKGSWARITSFNGAKGPYCRELNRQLAAYGTNFDANGVIRKKPSICTTATDGVGVKYDMGKYAYRMNSRNTGYDFVGKK